VTVKAGQVTRPISVKMRPDGAIAGTVTGPGGKPVTGICVRALAQGNQPTRFLVVTGSDGTYQIGSLQPGRYLIEFFARCRANRNVPSWWKNSSTALNGPRGLVRSGQTRTGINASLTRQK